MNADLEEHHGGFCVMQMALFHRGVGCLSYCLGMYCDFGPDHGCALTSAVDRPLMRIAAIPDVAPY